MTGKMIMPEGSGWCDRFFLPDGNHSRLTGLPHALPALLLSALLLPFLLLPFFLLQNPLRIGIFVQKRQAEQTGGKMKQELSFVFMGGIVWFFPDNCRLQGIMYAVIRTTGKTIKAIDATAVIHYFVLAVEALSLAHPFAAFAKGTCFVVERDPKQRPAGKYSQDTACRTDRIAEKTAPPCRHHHNG